MSTSVGFLDFFILEAGEYVEQLDGLLVGAGMSGPDPDALQRAARSLRGSATMAKLPAFADLAHAIERAGRSLRDGSLTWDARIRGPIVSAVDELKILLHNVRNWSDTDIGRANARTRELLALLPAPRSSGTPAIPGGQAGMSYLAGEASNVAAGFELLLTRPEDAAGAAMVLKRVRALRGVAAVKDLPLVGRVLEAAEQAATPLEQGQPAVSETQRDLLSSSVELLRGTAQSLRGGPAVDADGPTARRFGDALDAWLDSSGENERVVPITSLFHDDDGPHVVSASSAPPTTISERFRLELVSQGEHLHRLAEEAAQAPDDAARERFRRELRRSLRAVRALAESFEEQRVVELASRFMSAPSLDDATLGGVARMARMLSDPSLAREALDAKLTAIDDAPEEVVALSPTPASTPVVPPPAPPAPPTPAPTPVATVRAIDEPTARPSAAALLERGIDGLARLEAVPLERPVELEQPVVAIEALLYRGRSAVRRAIEIREEVRRRGEPPTMDTIEELFDLLDLALLDEAAA